MGVHGTLWTGRRRLCRLRLRGKRRGITSVFRPNWDFLFQIQFPGLADQIGAEAVVFFLFDELKASVDVEVVGGVKDGLSPESDFAVAAGSGEGDAFIDEDLAEAETAGASVD